MSSTAIRQIDFNSNIPYYVQFINILKDKINHNEWKPGDQIPGEPELCIQYGISRTVVRQSLHELESDGLVIRRKGKGTFISNPKVEESLVQKLTGFYQDMVEKGYKPVTKVLHHRVSPASEKVAMFLEITPGSRVFDIKRLRSIGEDPLQLVTNYIPYELCPQLQNVDLTNRSLYEFLENDCHLMIARGRRYVESVVVSEADARLLNIDRGAPVLMLESVIFLPDGRPLEYYQAFHRGDRTRFEVELVRLHKEQERQVDADQINLPENNIKIV